MRLRIERVRGGLTASGGSCGWGEAYPRVDRILVLGTPPAYRRPPTAYRLPPTADRSSARGRERDGVSRGPPRPARRFGAARRGRIQQLAEGPMAVVENRSGPRGGHQAPYLLLGLGHRAVHDLGGRGWVPGLTFLLRFGPLIRGIDGARLLSRRVMNDETELLQLIGDVLKLPGDVRWAWAPASPRWRPVSSSTTASPSPTSQAGPRSVAWASGGWRHGSATASSAGRPRSQPGPWKLSGTRWPPCEAKSWAAELVARSVAAHNPSPGTPGRSAGTCADLAATTEASSGPSASPRRSAYSSARSPRRTAAGRGRKVKDTGKQSSPSPSPGAASMSSGP